MEVGRVGGEWDLVGTAWTSVSAGTGPGEHRTRWADVRGVVRVVASLGRSVFGECGFGWRFRSMFHNPR